jgi:hypothetical protein
MESNWNNAAPRPERRISDAQIEDETETDLIKDFCETRQKFDAAKRSALENVSAARKSQNPKFRF